jgi:hypothetical protein
MRLQAAAPYAAASVRDRFCLRVRHLRPAAQQRQRQEVVEEQQQQQQQEEEEEEQQQKQKQKHKQQCAELHANMKTINASVCQQGDCSWACCHTWWEASLRKKMQGCWWAAVHACEDTCSSWSVLTGTQPMQMVCLEHSLSVKVVQPSQATCRCTPPPPGTALISCPCLRYGAALAALSLGDHSRSHWSGTCDTGRPGVHVRARPGGALLAL